VIVNRKEALFGAPEPRAEEAEGIGGDGAFSAAAGAAAAASLSSRGPADTPGDERSERRASASTKGAIARRGRRSGGIERAGARLQCSLEQKEDSEFLNV